MKEWALNQMNDTFICPGLVIRMPASRGTRLYRIDYCYSHVCDITNLITGKPSIMAISNIRQFGHLVGTNFKRTKP